VPPAYLKQYIKSPMGRTPKTSLILAVSEANKIDWYKQYDCHVN